MRNVRILLMTFGFLALGLLANTTTQGEEIYHPTFYDVTVKPGDSISVCYDIDLEKEYLLCFSNTEGLYAEWEFNKTTMRSPLAIQLDQLNAPPHGHLRIHNGGHQTLAMANCNVMRKK